MAENIKTYRTKSITISLPKPNSYSWIEYVLQEYIVDADGNPVQLIDDIERVSKRFDHVYTDMVTFADPMTGQSYTISVAGLSRAIKAAIIKWVTDGGEIVYDPANDTLKDRSQQ
jgi:hypothetical protein